MKKVIFKKMGAVTGGFVVVVLLSVSVLGAAGSMGGSANSDKDPERLRAALEAIYGGSRDWELRRALEDYKEKGADIARWADDSRVARPENAALLYYRALAHRPEADPCTTAVLQTVMQGGEPDDRLRTYLGQCLLTIELTQLAGPIEDCTWGFQYYERPREILDTLGLLRQLAFLLDVHVRTLTADGHHRAALENCLVMRQLARHLGDDIYVQYAISRGIDSLALRDVLRVLSRMPENAEMLLWLRHQLAASKGTPWRPQVALSNWRDRQLKKWQLREGDRVFDRQWVLDRIESERSREKAMKLTDRELLIGFLYTEQMFGGSEYGLAVPSEVLAEARRECDKFLDEAIKVMGADMSYKDKREKLGRLEDDLEDRQRRWDPICLLEEAPKHADGYYWLMVPSKAYLNAALVAIEVGLTRIGTGNLPETLPEALPEDPFSGADFEYERTEGGFVLRFDPENLSRIRDRQFEFRFDHP